MADSGDPPLLGGLLCLDFANTLEWRGSERQHEWLTGYDALVAWAERSGAVDPREAAELRAYAGWAPGSAAQVVVDARGLREAIYRVATACVTGEAPGAEALDDLNRRLAPLLAETRLNVTPDGLIPAWGGGSEALERVLWPVARSAFDLLSGPDVERLRECAGRDCHWLFLDCSKNGSRRWCAMSNCGNLAKARRHRARSQTSVTHGASDP